MEPAGNETHKAYKALLGVMSHERGGYYAKQSLGGLQVDEKQLKVDVCWFAKHLFFARQKKHRSIPIAYFPIENVTNQSKHMNTCKKKAYVFVVFWWCVWVCACINLQGLLRNGPFPLCVNICTSRAASVRASFVSDGRGRTDWKDLQQSNNAQTAVLQRSSFPLQNDDHVDCCHQKKGDNKSSPTTVQHRTNVSRSLKGEATTLSYKHTHAHMLS